MFDIGWSEMAVIALVALLLFGPKELPNALRTGAKWLKQGRKLARTGIADYPGYAIPSYEDCFEAYLNAARLTNPAARFAGVSLNTSKLDADAARRAMDEVASRVDLPCTDPVRFGVAGIVDRILAPG